MTRLLSVLVLSCAAFAIWAAAPGVAARAAQQQSATFYRDVQPLVQQRCQGCHRAGEIGPMPLESYETVRPWARAIRQAVAERKMPPWNAAGPVGQYRNDPRLSQADIDTILSWVDGGAPAGDPKDAPPPRVFATGWSAGTPDAIFEMPETYAVPASGTIEYTYVIVPTGFTEDRWVTSAEVRPGNRAVVHHANVYVREPDSPWLREYPKGRAFVPGNSSPERGQGFGLGGASSAGASLREQVIAGFIPGRPVKPVPPGYGLLIPAGSDLVFQLHYTANGTAAGDRTRVGFIFAGTTPTRRVIRIQASNASFAIPPGAADYPIAATAMLGTDVELIDAYPHMHVRGKSMTLTAVHPSGRVEELVRVPRYDFNWQHVYEFAERVTLRKGTLLRADAIFDNSPANRSNPDPKAIVRWGDQTWEEMMVGFFDVAIPARTDPRIAVLKQ